MLRKIAHKVYKWVLKTFFPCRFIQFNSDELKKREPEMQYLSKLCNKNKNSVDVGVLWGGYTNELEKHSKHVYSFEANPSQFKYLSSVQSQGCLEKTKLYNVALSNDKGDIVLKIPLKTPGNATVDSNNNLADKPKIEELIVKKDKFDNFCIKNIGFIKIDVEGHEFPVLQGMRGAIKRCKPNILIEIEERHNENSFNNVVAFFKELGYKGYFFLEGKFIKIEKFHFKKYQNKRNNIFINNFIFLNKEMKNNVKSLFKNGD